MTEPCEFCLPSAQMLQVVWCLQVILLTDADVDGAHIRTLLLTFLFRYCRALFQEGHIYVGVPPLYKLEVGKKAQYCYDDQELHSMTQGLASGSYSIQRFKVKHTTLQPGSLGRCCTNLLQECVGL